MKGVILHGGSGTRLRPLTYTDVKQLLPVAGKPISEYALLSLKSVGISEINIIVGEVGAKEVQEYYRNGEKWGVNVTYTYQGKPLGIAHAIGLVEKFVNGEDFIVYLGDNYLQEDLERMKTEFEAGRYAALLALIKVKNPSRFGVAILDNGRIKRLVEKPKEFVSDLAITGIYFLNPLVFRAIETLKPSGRGELEITEAFQLMLDDGQKIGYSTVDGWWKDTGTVDEFLDCNRMVLDNLRGTQVNHTLQNIKGRVSLGENVSIDSESKVLGPCYIGSNSRIIGSYVGPYTSIGSNCIIKDSEIENSVVMDSCTISLGSGNRLRESLLGANVSVESKGHKGNGITLVLGRDSKVVL